VIAVKVGGDTISGNAELAREPDAFVTTSAGISRKVLLGNRRVGIFVRLDGMDAVAIGTNRRKLVTTRDGLPVNAGVECGLNVGVALAAGGGHIELVDRRLRVVAAENGVGAMAIGADGCFHRAVFDGAAVNAVLVGDEGLRADTV